MPATVTRKALPHFGQRLMWPSISSLARRVSPQWGQEIIVGMARLDLEKCRESNSKNSEMNARNDLQDQQIIPCRSFQVQFQRDSSGIVEACR
jgi:hypothetical protein